MKIFIVDDEPFMCNMLVTFFKDKFPEDEAIAFETGERALRNIYQKPDAIILDFNLDRVDEKAHSGIDILKEMKKMLPDAPIIMLTAQDSPAVALEAVKFGAYDYVVKNENAFHRLQLLFENIHGYKHLSRQFSFQRMMNIVLAILLAAILFGILAIRFS